MVAIACDAKGNVDLDDLKSEQRNASNVALMVTYPLPTVYSVTNQGHPHIVRAHIGQVCMDGANNQTHRSAVPSEIGADICHLNLHCNLLYPS